MHDDVYVHDLQMLKHHYRKSALCRVSSGLPSVFFGHSAKKNTQHFAECKKKTFGKDGKEALC
jgi:hypothetical protein